MIDEGQVLGGDFGPRLAREEMSSRSTVGG